MISWYTIRCETRGEAIGAQGILLEGYDSTTSFDAVPGRCLLGAHLVLRILGDEGVADQLNRVILLIAIFSSLVARLT